MHVQMFELPNVEKSYGRIARRLRKAESTVASAMMCSSPSGNNMQENTTPQINTATLGTEGNGISGPTTCITQEAMQRSDRRTVITDEIETEI